MKILVIGESCLDIFIYGKADRICPEAPVPVFNPSNSVKSYGMAGNVFNNIKSLCLKEDINIKIHIETNIIRGSKTRYIDTASNQMFLRVDNDLYYKNEHLNNIEDYDIVIVSDYNKGFLSEKDLIEIGGRAKCSFIDTKKKYNSEWANLFSFIKINEKEAIENGFYDNWKEAHKNTIVTLAEKGCTFNFKKFAIEKPSEVRDVCGAGDTFLASLAFKYFITKDIEESIIFAQECCQIVISKKGVTVV
jgi:bifunctional ADP-heptose synthase (sugar kinase/adenylyltransferase)